MSSCGKNGCVIALRMESPDTGWCYVHGDRYMVAPLPRPQDDVEKKVTNWCVDCGHGIKDRATRCVPCAHKEQARLRAKGDNSRFRGHAWEIDLGKREHPWVMPV